MSLLTHQAANAGSLCQYGIRSLSSLSLQQAYILAKVIVQLNKKRLLAWHPHKKEKELSVLIESLVLLFKILNYIQVCFVLEAL